MSADDQCLCGRGVKSVAVQACGGYLWVCSACAIEWEQAKAERDALIASGTHPRMADRVIVAKASPPAPAEPTNPEPQSDDPTERA